MNYILQANIIILRLDALYVQYWNINVHNRIKHYEKQLERIYKIMAKDKTANLAIEIATVREQCLSKNIHA